MYRPSMGKVVEANCKLRAWGTTTSLDVKGMFRTKISTKKGAERYSWVYVVGGHKPEPLLGDKDVTGYHRVSLSSILRATHQSIKRMRMELAQETMGSRV